MRILGGTLVGGTLVGTSLVCFMAASSEPVSGSLGTTFGLGLGGVASLAAGGTVLGWTLHQLGRYGP